MNHNRFLKVARQLAAKTTDMRRGFGCVIVDGNKIISTGRNRRSHPGTPDLQLNGMKYWGLHAETEALIKADISVRGLTIYIHGQNVGTGSAVNSWPCPLCEKVLKEKGIKKVVFTTKTGIEERIYA